VVRSSLRVRLEDVLPRVPVALAVVHGAEDVICSHAYAAALAADHGGRLVVVPGATHSWPYADGRPVRRHRARAARVTSLAVIGLLG
jgi:pimeloyl-ACP methyl ester carboxylesterase